MSLRWREGLLCGGVVALVGVGEARAQHVPPEGPVVEPATPEGPTDPTAPTEPLTPPTYPPETRALPPPPPSSELRTQPEAWKPGSGFGAALLLGGGVDNFVDDGIGRMTGPGGAWNLRLVSGTRQPLGVELGYVGDAHDVTGPGIMQDDFVLRTGVEGALRLQVPVVRGSSLVEPFALVGLGWSHYRLVGEGRSVTFMQNSDHVLSVPFGAGLAGAYRGFIVDARVTYRMVADDDMFGGADMSGWSAGLSLGAEF